MSDMDAQSPPNRPVREKLSWGEQRDRRRRRRKAFEEVLGWILVPIILYVIWLLIQEAGGIPPEAIEFFKELVAHGSTALR